MILLLPPTRSKALACLGILVMLVVGHRPVEFGNTKGRLRRPRLPLQERLLLADLQVALQPQVALAPQLLWPLTAVVYVPVFALDPMSASGHLVYEEAKS